MIFHLGDTFFFVNELVKSVATSPEEQQIFADYLHSKKRRDAKYGRAVVVSSVLPYFYACFRYGGWAWKLFTFLGLMSTINATFDVGMYLNFCVNGMPLFKKLLNLDPQNNFSAIQTRLFMKWCAS